MKIPKINKDEIIAVVWDDTFSQSGWSGDKELDKITPAEIKSVGFFHKVTKRGFTIKHNLGKDGEADCTVIPTGCIKKIKFLRLSDEKPKHKNTTTET